MMMMMMRRRRRLSCCSGEREISMDFDEHEINGNERVMTYDGLENSIRINQTYENETDSLDDDGDDELSCSSTKDVFGSFPPKWEMSSESPSHISLKEKSLSFSIDSSEVDAMRERFANLLLGEDITGGCKGLTSALALSNAITNLAARVFGELWKLEPLPDERKSVWRKEMDWLLSPTKYMVELVPAKQNGANGRMLEIMTPKARADIHMNLPALQKLDSMLIEALDSMVSTEFWYAEGGSRAEGRSKNAPKGSKRWWLPMPQVPDSGLSDSARKKLIKQGGVVHQVFKAARSINQSVLFEMPVPTIIGVALPKSGKASLSEGLYKVLTAESRSAEEMLKSLNLKSEHSALDVINRLEAAVFSWNERIREQGSGDSPVRASWSTFIKDPMSELDRMELLLDRAEALIQQLKTKYPNLPQTFLDATKIQYGKDIGHSILEAYSRVLGNLAFSILCRIGDVMREDAASNPSAATCCFAGVLLNVTNNYSSVRFDGVDGTPHSTSTSTPSTVTSATSNSSRSSSSSISISSGTCDSEYNSYCDAKPSPSVSSTPSRRRVWCIGREACVSVSPPNSP
ncbi:rop guanine nucleotide exchange factor 14 [Humulus lupulus]|uniref:rop guanine nucleotide exchange factor 14 n=1 Tax=Humulus lupulus TaxID=3486 RepID=UPI002B4021DB|nr:rop guanine nucleotide exchange factor 14 [Humulus lupulus]